MLSDILYAHLVHTLWAAHDRLCYHDARDKADAEGEGGARHWMFTLKKCMDGIESAAMRITSAEELQTVKGFGPATVKVRSSRAIQLSAHHGPVGRLANQIGKTTLLRLPCGVCTHRQ